MTATHTRLAVLLALGAVVALVAPGCRGNKSDVPPVHLNQNMDFQQYYRAQEKNDWFPDHRAMRPVVAGTVAAGQLNADDHLTLGRGTDGRLVDTLPEGMTVDATLLARGEERYNIYCAICHEKSGYGDGIIVSRGLQVAPPSYHEPRLQAMPLGYIYDVITQGKGTMKPYAAQISVSDRWAITAWVRVLQASQRASAADVPADQLQNINIEGGGP